MQWLGYLAYRQLQLGWFHAYMNSTIHTKNRKSIILKMHNNNKGYNSYIAVLLRISYSINSAEENIRKKMLKGETFQKVFWFKFM